MTIFLSYSHVNKEQAEDVRRSLEDQGLDCFMAEKDLRAGEDFERRILQSLKRSEALFLLVSEESLESDWVHFEWGAAWALGIPVVPILYGLRKRHLPTRLRTRQVGELHKLDRAVKEYLQTRKVGNSRSWITDERLAELMQALISRLEPHDTVYSDRETHYEAEKREIAEHYARFLGERVEHLLKAGVRKALLVFDSGTTIAPVLEVLARQAEQGSSFLTEHVDRVHVFTNNIRGVQNLLRFRAPSPDGAPDRYSEIPFECSVLPGRVLAVYQALADESTVAAQLRLKDQRSHIVAVVTGNYVAFGSQRVMLPLARASFHPDVKASLCAVADEIHLLAPLPKVLGRGSAEATTVDEITESLNASLEFSNDATTEAKRPYQLVSPEILARHTDIKGAAELANVKAREWSRKTILVACSRTPADHVFAPRYAEIRQQLKRFTVKGVKLRGGPYFEEAPAPDLPLSKVRQLHAELPHEWLRERDRMVRYFGALG